MPPPPSPRGVAAALVLTLIVWLTAWHTVRLSNGAAAVALIMLLPPWFAVLPGIARGNRRTQQLGAFLTAPYLAYGLTEVLANPGARFYAGGTVLIAFAVFVAIVHSLRTDAASHAIR